MKQKKIDICDLSINDNQNVLDFFNSAYTAEDLVDTFKKVDGKLNAVKLAEGIMNKRTELNMFENINQLLTVQGISEQIFSNIVSFLIKPPFKFDSEKLHYVMWSHGSSLNVENPEEFSLIQRRGRGTKIVAGEFVPGESGYSQSWVHFSIPTPAFSLGTRLAIRSVLLNYETSVPPYDIMGRPIVGLEEINIWDGHIKIASKRLDPILTAENRYRKIEIPVAHNVQWGIGVSVRLLMMTMTSDRYGWIDFAAVGAEFVTRSGLVIGVNN